MAPARYALVTEAEARTHLGVSASDDPSNDQLDLIINGVSERIAQRMGRTYLSFDENDAASVRVYRHDGSALLPIEDAREVTEIEATTDPTNEDSWTVVPAGDYVLEPVNGPTVQRIRFFRTPTALGVGWAGLTGGRIRTDRTLWPREEAGLASYRVWIRVNAKWGYGPDTGTVPGNVKLAALMWLQNIHRREQAYFSEDLSRAVAEMGIPPDVEELLAEEGSPTASVSAV
jgi:hypothetical protein